MKRFLLKGSLYFLILAILIAGAMFYAKKRSPKELFFISNSVTLNLKAGFVKEHYDKFKNSRIYVIGSSMSLNNLDALMIQDSLHASTMNLASWGLRLSNFKDAAFWRQDKLLIYNTQYADFHESDIQLKDGYRFDVSNSTELLNIFTDFKSYLLDQHSAKNLLYNTPNTDYEYCTFDACGSALLSDSGFVLKPQRWNLDMYKYVKFDTTMLTKFVADIKNAIGPQPNNVRILLAFSPGRRIFYNVERSKMVVKLGDMLKKSCPNVIFLNLFDQNYPDELFVDNCHMNRKGADRFTQEIIDTIKAKKIAY
jgi:hypothetical protein